MLRELAATIGVTHAAPRRYFAGRLELLDALAVEGFVRLGAGLREAAEAPSELMFAHKHGADGEAVGVSAAAAFAPISQVFHRCAAEDLLLGRKPERVAVTFLATLRGLAGLVNCGVIPTGHFDDLIEEAVAQTNLQKRAEKPPSA
ncbi:hypothetical protein [Microbacterium sp. A196]|uniref:hypothetical protein n=1 Tax=Microbacterium sp. A196 TaxID=3457320 RepID=UPI003FD577CB